MIPTNAFSNMGSGTSNIMSSKSMNKVAGFVCENPMLAAGVGCIAAGISILAGAAFMYPESSCD